MAETETSEFRRLMRRMREEVLLLGGVGADATSLCIHPGLELRQGRVIRNPQQPAPDGWGARLDRVACLVIGCYMESLGRVLNGGLGNKHADFCSFIQECVPDYPGELDSTIRDILRAEQRWEAHPRGSCFLYYRYRRNFLREHLAQPEMLCRRGGEGGPYWSLRAGTLHLNVDRLLRGFVQGLDLFTEAHLGHAGDALRLIA